MQVTGKTGTGKTLVLTHKLTHDAGELVTPLFLMFSARTSAAQVQVHSP